MQLNEKWLDNVYSKDILHETRRNMQKYGFVIITSFYTNIWNILMTL